MRFYSGGKEMESAAVHMLSLCFCLQAKKQSYRHEKKRVELTTRLTLLDPSTNLTADFLKVNFFDMLPASSL